MNILLIRPLEQDNVNTRLPQSLNRVQGVLPPLGLAYLAAVLEQAGHDVAVLDAPALGYSRDDLRREVRNRRPALAGVTAMTSTLRGALDAARMAKEAGAVTVLGGPQLAAYPAESVSYDFVDYGVLGEGERPLGELAEALGGGEAPRDIPGLIRKDGEKVVVVPPPYYCPDLDALPFPAMHKLPMTRYASIIGLHPVTTMVTSRGCPFQCSFCFKGPSDLQYRTRNPARVVEEMAGMVRCHRVREIMFYDDTIALNREHLAGLCREIMRKELRCCWESPVRVNDVNREMLGLMRQAGCRRLRFGIESGDEEILRHMRKGITLEQVRKVFAWTRETGMETFAYFMIGYPGETPETVRRTIALARELDPDLVMFTVVTPYPGTQIYRQAREEGVLAGDYWRDFTLGRAVQRLPYFIPDAEKLVKQAYRNFYLRPGYLWKRLRRLRSWRDLRKHFQAAWGILRFRMKDRPEAGKGA